MHRLAQLGHQPCSCCCCLASAYSNALEEGQQRRRHHPIRNHATCRSRVVAELPQPCGRLSRLPRVILVGPGSAFEWLDRCAMSWLPRAQPQWPRR
eukprot:scaffold71129_cov54-Phaeocystis_antarctica.AAC.1